MSDLLVGYGGDKPTAPSGPHEALVTRSENIAHRLRERSLEYGCGSTVPMWTSDLDAAADILTAIARELQEARAEIVRLQGANKTPQVASAYDLAAIAIWTRK